MSMIYCEYHGQMEDSDYVGCTYLEYFLKDYPGLEPLFKKCGYENRHENFCEEGIVEMVQQMIDEHCHTQEEIDYYENILEV